MSDIDTSTAAVENADTASFERWLVRRPVPESMRPFFRALVAKRNALAAERDAAVQRAEAAEALVQACAPLLKDGETPAECIARNRQDTDTTLGLLASERRAVEALLAQGAAEQKAVDMALEALESDSSIAELQDAYEALRDAFYPIAPPQRRERHDEAAEVKLAEAESQVAAYRERLASLGVMYWTPESQAEWRASFTARAWEEAVRDVRAESAAKLEAAENRIRELEQQVATVRAETWREAARHARSYEAINIFPGICDAAKIAAHCEAQASAAEEPTI